MDSGVVWVGVARGWLFFLLPKLSSQRKSCFPWGLLLDTFCFGEEPSGEEGRGGGLENIKAQVFPKNGPSSYLTAKTELQGLSVQFNSVAQSCPTLCDPMNRSTPGLPVHYQLPEFTQTHVHQVGDAIQPSHPLSSSSPPAPNPSQHQGLFQ